MGSLDSILVKMKQLLFSCFGILSLISASIALFPKPKEGHFRAAVYEHDLIVPDACLYKVCSREEAISLMEVNLQILEEQVLAAARNGAQIILLPEDGIHGFGHMNRQALRPFLEFVSPIADGSIPCYEDGVDDAYVSTRLSCLAAENEIFIAANYATVVDGCDYCEHGGECYFNTNVVFDNKGAIVAVYHKFNLWTSELTHFDIDESPKIVTFETEEMGTFGLSICEDLLWRSPVVDLAEQQGIDTLLLPLSWWDMYPHQLAHSNQDAWARGLQINVMSANTHSSAGWTSGSGIYTSSGHKAYVHDLNPNTKGTLLIADLPISPEKRNISWSEYANENIDKFEETGDMFKEVAYDDLYNFVPLRNGMTAAKVCTDDKSFCCLAEFEVEFTNTTVFSLGIFKGDHSKDGSIAGQFRMEMCTILKCDPVDSANTCSQDLSWDYDFLATSDTVFKSLKLSGTFSDDAGVYPEVLFNDIRLHPNLMNVSIDGVLSLVEEAIQTETLVSMSLFGRDYSKDPAYPDQFCPSGEKYKS